MNTVRAARRSTRLLALVSAGLVALSLSGCGGGGAAPAPSEAASGDETAYGSAFDQSVHDLLPDAVRSSGTVRVGITPEDPPFMVKVNGVYEGVIPDLMDEVAAIMGVRFQPEELPFPGMIPAIQSNKISYAWTSMFDTLEREEVLDFVTYVSASYGLLVQKGNPKNINFLEDLCGTVAATTKGTVMADALEEQRAKCAAEGNEMTISLYDNQSAAQVQLQAGRVDSFLGTAAPLGHLAAHADGGETFEMAEGTYPAGYLAVGSTKNEPGLAKAMQAALRILVEEGVYGEILAKHGVEDAALTADMIILNGRTSGELE